jgi:hypothetical protein
MHPQGRLYLLQWWGCTLFALAMMALPCRIAAYPDTLWTRSYGGYEHDRGRSVIQTFDGGFMIAGHTKSWGAGGHDVYLIRIDTQGDTLWTRTYGGADDDRAFSVAQTSDSGFVVAGHTRSYGSGGYDVYLIRTNASGDTLWTRAYGGADDDHAMSIVQNSDGRFAAVGHTESYGAGGSDVFILTAWPDGEVAWIKTYGGIGNDWGYSISGNLGSGYIVAGGTESYGSGGCDVYLLKTDAHGDTLWTKTYGGPDDDCAFSVAQASYGCYIAAGYTRSYGAAERDIHLMKISSNGFLIGSRTYGGPGQDCARSVFENRDGGYVIAGWTDSYGAGGRNACLIRTDCAGDIFWSKTYGGANMDEGYSVIRTADSCYIVVGVSESSSKAKDYDVYVIKDPGNLPPFTLLNDPMHETSTYINTGYPGYPESCVGSSNEIVHGYTDQVVHPDILYFPSGWGDVNGRKYKYWMGIHGFKNGNRSYEQPCILVSNNISDDNWQEPNKSSLEFKHITYSVNPITGWAWPPGEGHFSDIDLVYNDRTDEIWCYVRNKCFGEDWERIELYKTRDGIHWDLASTDIGLHASAGSYLLSPTVVKEGEDWWMWLIDASSYFINHMQLYYSNDGTYYTLYHDCGYTFRTASDREPWHIDIVKYNDEFWGLLVECKWGFPGGSSSLCLITSTDKKRWFGYDKPILNRNPAGWDNRQIYRSSCIIQEGRMDMIYTAAGYNGEYQAWYAGYTHTDSVGGSGTSSNVIISEASPPTDEVIILQSSLPPLKKGDGGGF